MPYCKFTHLWTWSRPTSPESKINNEKQGRCCTLQQFLSFCWSHISCLPFLTRFSVFFFFPLHISCPCSFSLSVRLNQYCSGLAFAESAAAPLGKNRSHWSISPSHYFLLGGHNQNWMATSQRQTLLLCFGTRLCLLSLHCEFSHAFHFRRKEGSKIWMPSLYSLCSGSFFPFNMSHKRACSLN